MRSTCSQRGHTLIEVMVASTLFVVFIAGLYGATRVYFSLLRDQQAHTEVLTSFNIVRARLINDTRGVTSVACSASDTLQLTTIGAGPPQIVEYKTDGVHLVRWASGENKDYYIADGVSIVSCQTFAGGAGVDVALTFGESPNAHALHVSLTEL